MSQKTTLLLILDGFGLAPFDQAGNAITPKTAPHIFQYMQNYPSTRLAAHGSAVGLRAGQEGNSEAGHLSIGAGRIIEQDIVQISHAIKDASFANNEVFQQAVEHIQIHQGRAHVMGLLTGYESAHASPDHWYAMLDYLDAQDIEEVYLHLFTDGRDASPHSSVMFLQQLRAHMKANQKIATITGRFYAMDRNKIWERTQKAYDAIACGIGRCHAGSVEEAITQSYNRDETDEYICPTVIHEGDAPVATVQSGDAVFFVNARADRARQLTKAFLRNDCIHKDHQPIEDIAFVTMTQYGPDLPGVLTAFPGDRFEAGLVQALGASTRQLYIAETEKYAHVTYFINGGHEVSLAGETRELIPSAVVDSYVTAPEMQSAAIVDRVIDVLIQDRYDFIGINLCNADMLGHTGNLAATEQSVRLLDEQVARLVTAVRAKGAQLVITADHGNAEMMIDPDTKEMMTAHTTNPVPCIIIADHLRGKQLRSDGSLADVAPTILDLMGKEKSSLMTGESLLE